MRMFTLSTVLLLVSSLVMACGTIETDDPDAVFLRIENMSSHDFSSVIARFPGVEVSFDAISSGQASEYQKVDTAYRYGYVEVEANGETYRLQPFDYVGEEPLEKGRYTYELDIVESGLSLQFERD